MTKHNFKANIRLKDIIGQGLINNSNIAIIELIKNAKDAKSKTVKVIFEDASVSSPKSRIIIQDFGGGMDMEDIIYKWLNIAYSEKRRENRETRGSIYAGDKGIGRFSCDRLGKTLNLYTRRKDGDLIHLSVDWKKFEIDDRDKEISSVKLEPKAINDNKFEQETGLDFFAKGTCLVIEDLRETWGKLELERLKKELERFIIDPDGKFEVYLKSTDLKNEDGELLFDGIIENKLLAKLDDKTISIHSEIVDNGSTIRTEIHHYGETILSFEEDNPYSELKSVKAHIHYLSQGSKTSFKTITGYTSAEYGSIMFFLNGFRVMPYGEPKDDWLQLNQRKAQGTMRFLGTRDVFGIIEASDNERRLVPVSSREGMENNLAFRQLTDSDFSETLPAYIPGVMRILERYVVEGVDWDRIAPDTGEFSAEEITNALKLILEAHKKNKNLRNVKIDHKKINTIAKEKVKDYKEFVDDLMDRVSDKSVYELTPSEKRDLKKYVQRHDSALAQKTKTNTEYKQVIEVEKKRRLFAESHQTTDEKRVRYLQHLVGNLSEKVHDDLYDILKKESSDRPLSKEDIIKTIKKSYFDVGQIKKLSQIITKANFDMMSNNIRHDVFTYIEQYIKDVCENGSTWGLKIQYENTNAAELVLNMRPIQLSMLVDNILSNAKKAHAKNVLVKVYADKKTYNVEFSDDGDGLSKKYKPEDYFKAGITTTNGSGIGLEHVKQVVKELEGEVSIFNNDNKGATVRIRWDK